MHKLCLSDKVI